MFRIASSSKLGTFTGVALASAALSMAVSPVAFAAGDGAVMRDAQPVTIQALCREADGAAEWRIGNPNPGAVTLSWGAAASASLPYGYTTIKTAIADDDDTSAVTFHQDGAPDVTVPVSQTTCATPVDDCVDGYVRDNLTFSSEKIGTVTVSTANGEPLCDDVTVYLSAYTLPKTYDQSGIFDDSALPQQLFSSAHAVMQKGTDGTVTMTTNLPDACTDYQLDLYYGPEVTSVSYQGHGAQLIYGNVRLHTQTDCTTTPPTTGGHGGGQVLAASTTKPAATLADTGDSTTVPALSALTLMGAAVFVKFPVIGRIKKLFVK